MGYDLAGNVTTDGTYTYVYDAEGRPVTVGSAQTTFDAFGRAVEQNNNGTVTEFVYSPSGQIFATMNGQALNQYFVPIAGGATAVYNSTDIQYYRHADWLGSGRLTLTVAGMLYGDQAYAPFGESYAGSGTLPSDFTGQTKNTTLGQYDFMLRQYAPGQGRWLVPDPAGLAAVDITNPQTWNRYAYLANNPLNATDPLGLDDCASYDEPCNGQWGAVGAGGPGCDPTNYGMGSVPCTPNGQVYGGWGGGSVAGGNGGYGCGDPSYRAAHPIGCGLNLGTPYFPGGGGGGGGETLGIPNGLSTGSWGIPLPFPTNLNCPSGLSFLCGGIDPAMDAESSAPPSCVGIFFTETAAHFLGVDAQDVTNIAQRLMTMSPRFLASIAVPGSKAARGGLSWSQYFARAYKGKLALAEDLGTGVFLGQAIYAEYQGLKAEYAAAKAGNCE